MRSALPRGRSAALVAALALAALSACGGKAGAHGPPLPDESAGGSDAGAGSGGAQGQVSGNGGSSGTVPPAGGVTSTGGGPPGELSTGEVKLRLLTRAEFLASVQALFGTITTQVALPEDTAIAGFVSVGASHVRVSPDAAMAYESASQAIAAEVFGDAQRWQKLVGCQPKADLSDACVTTYIEGFGRSAFRRELTEEEVQQWVGVAQYAANLTGTAAQGLATATSGLLQSPHFLYRVEGTELDMASGRLKYDGLSMATRLSYALTGGPPSAALLGAATSGQLDTAEGIGTAAAPLLASATVVDRMTAFFSEYVQAPRVLSVSKDTTLFPTFDAALQSSMYEGVQLFLKDIVLAPDADVRSFYDSDQTFADAALAPFYGVEAPASGFARVSLPTTSGRAGILGQAGVLAGQSPPDRTSPTKRGIFVFERLICSAIPEAPQGVVAGAPVDPSRTTARQRLAAHLEDASCAVCHALFDPAGLALEHFDAIGRYRETENGLPIDATGTLDGMSFDGAAELGSVLRQHPNSIPCMLANFYRNVNGRAEDEQDRAQIENLERALAARGYVWSSFLADFVISDAFRSAPALPVTNGSME